MISPKPSSTRPVIGAGDGDRLAYMADLIQELATLAAEARLSRLADLLVEAHREALDELASRHFSS